MAQSAAHAAEQSLIDRLLDRIERWAGGTEIERMSAADVRILAHDIGLDASDLTRLAKEDRNAAHLLYSRLEQLGLSVAEIEAAGVGTQRDLERTCGLCADRAVCEHDLNERPESDAWRKICPNTWTFDTMEGLKRAGS